MNSKFQILLDVFFKVVILLLLSYFISQFSRYVDNQEIGRYIFWQGGSSPQILDTKTGEIKR